MGVPSISTNLAGFGCYMQEKVENPNAYGIYIADRRTKSYDESVNEIVDYMFNFCQFRFLNFLFYFFYLITF